MKKKSHKRKADRTILASVSKKNIGESLNVEQSDRDGLLWKILLLSAGVLLCVICLAINFLSPDFKDSSVQSERPIIAVLALLTAAFGIYIASLVFALKIKSRYFVLSTVIGIAIASRIILIGSHPFQEIDAYRYIWDGNVVAAGLNPYEFSPDEAKSASIVDTHPRLAQISEIRQADPGLNAILHRVHFPELPTVYPPISQAVFWASAKTTWITNLLAKNPKSLMCHLITMKVWITLFDLATMGLIILILIRLKMHLGWAIAYGWSPLVLKEFANTGHLDSIAIFFCILSVFLVLRFAFRSNDRLQANSRHSNSKSRRPGAAIFFSMVIGAVVACGVGAKLFPIVLAPLIAITLIRKRGWIPAISFSITAIIGSAGILYPIFQPSPKEVTQEISDLNGPVDLNQTTSSDGLYAFLSRWRMNDFIFMNIQENVEHPDVYDERNEPWFVIVPDETRKNIVESTHKRGNELLASVQQSLGRTDPVNIFQFPIDRTSFLIARSVTLGLFTLISMVLAFRLTRKPASPESEPVESEFEWQLNILVAAFLTLAWFWLTLPTQNPWYWCWAMPLVCFAKNRWWLVLSLFATAYYFRFWLKYHMANEEVMGTAYNGSRYFDFVVTWFEFGPFFLVLLVTTILMQWNKRKRTAPKSLLEQLS